MNHILQIFAGTWHEKNYSAEEILKKLDEVCAMLPVEKVIIGWTLDPGLYVTVGDFLHEKNVEMLLWLPVFSETDLLCQVDPSYDLSGNPVTLPQTDAAEGFVFCCPSSDKNLANTSNIYEKHFSACGFDGVFLDRIRTQSFLSGTGGALSCCCDSCRAGFSKRGVDLQAIAAAYTRKGNRFFDAAGFSNGTFRFQDPAARSFFTAKCDLIAAGVQELCRSFHDKNLSVGLDLFAPILSTFVGQDYHKISAEADFIKPMLYRMTDAPAGIGYEYEMLRNSLKGAAGYPDILMDEVFLEEQVKAFAALPCKKYPGIEINYDEKYAKTNSDYILRSLQVFKKNSLDGATLAWDVMMAPETHIRAVCEV